MVFITYSISGSCHGEVVERPGFRKNDNGVGDEVKSSRGLIVEGKPSITRRITEEFRPYSRGTHPREILNFAESAACKIDSKIEFRREITISVTHKSAGHRNENK